MDQQIVITCAACGAASPAGAEAWCPACGAPLSADADGWELSAAAAEVEPPVEPETRMTAGGWRRLPAACLASLEGVAARPRALAALIVGCAVVMAAIGAGAWFLIERQREAPLFPVLVGGRLGFIDGTGKLAIEPMRYDNRTLSSGFHEGRARMFVEGNAGFIDTSGEYVIPLQYDGADDFSEGLAAVWEGTQLLYIDTSGAVAIEVPGISEGGRFSEGLAAFGMGQALSGSDYGYLNKRGNVVISPRFAAVGEFSEGLAAVEVTGRGGQGPLWGYIDKAGTWVIEPQFTWAGPFHEGLAAVRTSAQDFGYIDKAGSWAIHPEPSGFLYAGSFSEGLACVEIMAGPYHDTPLFGFIDPKGHVAIQPAFDTRGEFSQGRAAIGVVSKDGAATLWGYIDKKGDWVVDPVYLKAGPFQPGGLAAAVRSGSVWMLPDAPDGYLGVHGSHVEMVDAGLPDIVYIDRSGKVVWESTVIID